MAVRSFLVLCLAAGTKALDTVNYGAFLATATYSVANQLGFFDDFDLSVIYNQVPNSTAAFNSILSGEYDILSATVDNALNYRFNLNKTVTVLGQLDQGPDLVVASTASITSFDQLKGKPIIVDSPLSGYAYLLQEVLAAHGLYLAKGDYYFMTVGGTAARYSALSKGVLPNGTEVYATILNYPFTVEGQFLPEGQAPNILARISDVVAPITSSALTIRQATLADCDKNWLLTRFIAALYAANRVLLDPTYRKCAIQAIATQLSVPMQVARVEYFSAIDSLTGEISPGNNFTVSSEGIMNDVAVRSAFGGFASVPKGFDFVEALLPGKGNLIDYSVRDAAVKLFETYPTSGNCTALCPAKL
ncbi:hypothetical protein GQ53DRAFT_775990 [Thozetella sp. PMI_491]|nr:hypothetical protein GQ53DRAFT_775990 [Thozetella sp. PMI_491]